MVRAQQVLIGATGEKRERKRERKKDRKQKTERERLSFSFTAHHGFISGESCMDELLVFCC